MYAAFAAALHPACLGPSQCSFSKCGSNAIHPGTLECARIGSDFFLNHCFINRVDLEEFAGKLPKLIGSTLHAGMAFLCSIAQASHPTGTSSKMILHLLECLLTDSANPLIARVQQLLEQQRVPEIKIELSSDRHREIAVCLFHQEQIPELVGITQKSELIFGASFAFDLGGIFKPELRLPVQIERDVGKCEILLQGRSAAAPFSETLAQDETAVSEAQEIIEK